MKGSLSLGKVMGIPFGIDYSWFVIFFFVTVILAHYYFPARYEDWPVGVYWGVGLGTSLLFFASVVAHELAHSFVAIRRGIPVKSIALFFFGGVASIAKEATRPATELLMASAGPVSSLGVAGLFALVWLVTRNIVEPVAAMSLYLAWLNLALGALNMVPGFPMDGGRVLRSLVWWRNQDYMGATRIAVLAGQVIGYLLILGGVAMIVVVDPWVWGMWGVFIGVFLSVAGSASYRHEVLRDNLRGLRAQDVMTPDCRRVPASLTLEAAVADYFESGDERCLLVEEQGEAAGVIAPKDAKRVPRQRWRVATVAEAMTSIEKVGTVCPGDDGLTTLERMEEGGLGLALVRDQDRVVGIVERDRLIDLGLDRSEARGSKG